MRGVLADVAGPPLGRLSRVEGRLTCVVGIGFDVLDRGLRSPRPSGLHPFPEVTGPHHTAVSTPGDLLLHIRAERLDLCFELLCADGPRSRGAAPSSTRCMASAPSTGATCWASSTAPRTRRARPSSRPSRSGTRIPRLRRRQLCGRAEVPARPRTWDALPVEQRSASSAARSSPTSSCPTTSSPRIPTSRSPRSWRTAPSGRSCATTCRSAGRAQGRVRHLLRRLHPHPRRDRADAAQHVRRRPTGGHRPPARFLDRGHRRSLYFVPTVDQLEEGRALLPRVKRKRPTIPARDSSLGIGGLRYSSHGRR